MPKVSVIIPVYNVEQYIERCARSLFEQTLDDIEYVFVDDCSPDNSINILLSVLKCYPSRVSQTKIIHHKKNNGLPMARRTGIKNATGDYIIQCDSDDWVDTEMYNVMYDMAVKTQSDAVICGYNVSDGISNKPLVVCHSTEKKSLIKNCLYQKESASLCSKLFKRDLFNNAIIYPQDAMGEDIALCLQLIYYSKKISFIPKPFYYYYSNPNSTTKKQSEKSIIDCFKQACNNASLLETFFYSHKDKQLLKALECFKHLQRNLLAPILFQEPYYKEWKNAFIGLNRNVLFMPLHFKDKIIFFMRLFRLRKY